MKKIIFLILCISSLFANHLEKTSLQLMWEDQFQFAGFYMAKEKGFYKELGLDVELKKFDQNLNITDEVLNNNADFGISSSSLVIDKSKGKDIILLGAIFQTSPLMLMALENSSINSIRDFIDKKLMITGEQLDFATFKAMLKSQSVDISSLKILPHSFNVEDLINKNTDLMLSYITNEPFLLQEKGYNAKIFYPKDYGFDFYEGIIFTSKKFFDKNPELVRNFYKASIKGWNYAFSNIDEAIDIIYSKYNSQNKSKEALKFEALEMKKLVFDEQKNIGKISKEKINLIANTYKVMGLMQNNIDLDSFIFNQTKSKIELNSEEKEYLKNKKSLTFCSHHDLMPFEAIRNDKHIGMLEDYVEQISNILNIDIDFLLTNSWQDSYNLTVKNECDFITTIASKKDREDILRFTNSYVDFPFVIATNINEPFLEDISKLTNKRVAVVKGLATSNQLKEKYKNINFIEQTSLHNALDAVKKGEVYAAIDSLAVVGYEIQNHFLGELKVSGKLEENFNLYMATAYENKELVSILNKALFEIDDVKRQEFFNKWLFINYQEANDFKYISRITVLLLIIFFILATIYRAVLFKKANKELEKRVAYEIEQNEKKNQILLQQSKMAAMGEMLENIAHQWRQPLSTISVSASGMQLKKEMNILSDDDFNDSINHIKQSVSYLTQTIEDFRNFVYQEKSMEAFKVKDAVRKTLQILMPSFSKHNIILIEEYEDIEIVSYENDLAQCLMNILTNSKDALKDLADDEKKLISIRVYSLDEYVKISICDSAKGIKDEIITRVFEPYFTTKHKSQGTGIGLYMSKNLIEQNLKGQIFVENKEFTCENENYFGACFEISIPKKQDI